MPPPPRWLPTRPWYGSRAGCSVVPTMRSISLSGPLAARLRGVVLLGADRAAFGQALARHAPDVPVVAAAGTRH